MTRLTPSSTTSVAPKPPGDSMGSWNGPLTLAAILVVACLLVALAARKRGGQ